MRFATMPNRTPDGRLYIVSRDNARCIPAAAAETLLAALEDWDALPPGLQAEYDSLNAGGGDDDRDRCRTGIIARSARPASPNGAGSKWLMRAKRRPGSCNSVGDTVRMECVAADGSPLFGAISKRVVEA